MAVVPNVSIDDVGQAFTAAIAGVARVRDAWMSFDDEGFDLWLLVEPLEMDEERALYALVDPLEERFPSSRFTLHVLNPRTFVSVVPERVVPARARHLGSRAPR